MDDLDHLAGPFVMVAVRRLGDMPFLNYRTNFWAFPNAWTELGNVLPIAFWKIHSYLQYSYSRRNQTIEPDLMLWWV